MAPENEGNKPSDQNKQRVMGLLRKGPSSITNLTEHDLAEIVKYPGFVEPEICTLFGLTGQQTWVALGNVIRERKATGASTGA
jgi:hypothetical protein